MKHGKIMARRILSVLLALVMCAGMIPAASASGPEEIQTGTAGASGRAARFPIGILRRTAAALMPEGTPDGGADGREVGVAVSYPSVKRDVAEVTYTIPGRRGGTGVHVVALIDVSIDNMDCLADLSEAMHHCEKVRYERKSTDDGIGVWGDREIVDFSAHDTGTTAQTITYWYGASEITGQGGDRYDSVVDDLNGGFDRTGDGQSNAAAGLEAALNALAKVPEGKTPVLFWALPPADRMDGRDLDAAKAKLEEARALVSSRGGRIVTWQMGDRASGWLAGDGIQAHSAAKDAFGAEVRDSLESIVSDGVKDFKLTLDLAGTEGLATGFADGIRVRRVRDGARYDAFEEFEYVVNGLKATVGTKKLYDSVEDLEITFTVKLDTDLNVEATVPGPVSEGGYVLGICDDIPGTYPSFDKSLALDRKLRTVTFKASASGLDDRKEVRTGLPGEFFLAPDASKWNSTGSEFSGWADESEAGSYVRSGEAICVPEADVSMVALWGHVDLKLMLGDVGPGEAPGNQMYPGTDTDSGWTSFRGKMRTALEELCGMDWGEAIASVKVVNEFVALPVEDRTLLNAVTVHGGIAKNGSSGQPNGLYIGLDEKNPVVAYVLNSKDDPSKYDLYLAGVGGVTAPYSLKEMFGDEKKLNGKIILTALQKADLSLLNTSKTKNMSDMFRQCGNLTSLDLSELNTFSADDMHDMFRDCSGLTSLDVSGFRTSKVTRMDDMFRGCSSLTELDVSGFDTSKVTRMDGMFRDCSRLAELDVRNFVTSSVTRMDGMFSGCKNLGTLTWDLEKFETSNVTDMSFMFYYCKKLKSIDVSRFNTSKVQSMSDMFFHCRALEKLDLSSFDTASVTNMSNMFAYCETLQELDVSMFNTANVTKMPLMFYQCSNMKTLNLGNNFNTEKVTDMHGLFGNCPVLGSLSFPDCFTTGNVTDMHIMFVGCLALTELDLRNFDTRKVDSMYAMFHNCWSLTDIEFGNNFYIGSGLYTTDENWRAGLFEGCAKLKSVDGIKWNPEMCGDVVSMKSMFQGCKALTSVNFNTGSGPYSFTRLEDMSHMFEGCTNLTSVVLNMDIGLTSINNMSHMFSNCTNLTSVDLHTDVDFQVDGKPKMDLRNVSYMFEYCTRLTSVNLGGWAVPNMTNMEWMFYDTGSNTLTINMAWTDLSGNNLKLDKILLGRKGPVVLEIGAYDSQKDVQKRNIVDAFASWNANRGLLEITADGTKIFPADAGTAVAAGAPMLLASASPARLLRLLASTAGVATVNKDVDYDQRIPTYKHPTPVSSTASYIVRIGYAGNDHAGSDHGISGRIDVRYPLPEGVEPDLESAVAVGGIIYGDGTSGTGEDCKVPGKEFRLERDGEGYVLTGSVRGIPAGAYMDVAVKCVIAQAVDSTKETVGGEDYWYWTGTSYAASNSGSAVSNPLRLWYSAGGTTAPEQPEKALVSYLYTGDVPAGIELPARELRASGDMVEPPNPAVPEGYAFDGWYKDDKGEAVTVYEVVEGDVTAGVKFYGRWRRTADAGSVTLTYEYDGDVPPEFRDFPLSTDLTLGDPCSVMVPDPVFGYDFVGWTSVTVDGVPDSNLPKAGVLDTSGLAPGVEIVYTGTWSAHKGTITFDANGAAGDAPEAMSVRIVAPEGKLPGPGGLSRDGMEFRGWSTDADGGGDVYPAGTPASRFVGEGKPVGKDGESVKLYAVWQGALELPKTGGPGTAVYAASGSVLVLAAWLVLAARRKRL